VLSVRVYSVGLWIRVTSKVLGPEVREQGAGFMIDDKELRIQGSGYTIDT